MDFNDALKQLEKVNADAERKAYWRKSLEAGIAAQKEREALKKHEERISQMLEKTQGDLKALDFSLENIKTEWAEKLLAWAVGETTRKPVIEYRTRHRELQTLIEDYRAALTIIEKKIKYGFQLELNHANTACDGIHELLEAQAKRS